MIQIVKADDRYHFENDWLSTYWHFSFDHYYDPNNVSFGPLRVFNDDVIRPASGFPMHGHREMEILTYVLDGALEHQDSAGNRGVTRAGEVQRMSAGTGITHSEYNASRTAPVHLVQIWILPALRGLSPSWEQKSFTAADRNGALLTVASGRGHANSVKIHQDAAMLVGHINPDQPLTHALEAGRLAYLYTVAGTASLNGQPLERADTARVTGESSLTLSTTTGADVLVLDLP